MPKSPEPKIKVLEQLYFQLVLEISQAENELLSSEQVTMIFSDEFIFEVRFKKKKKDGLFLVEKEDLVSFLFLFWCIEHLIDSALKKVQFFVA